MWQLIESTADLPHYSHESRPLNSALSSMVIKVPWYSEHGRFVKYIANFDALTKSSSHQLGGLCVGLNLPFTANYNCDCRSTKTTWNLEKNTKTRQRHNKVIGNALIGHKMSKIDLLRWVLLSTATKLLLFQS